MFSAFLADDSGATIVEYALLVSIVSIAIIGGANLLLLPAMEAAFGRVASALDGG